MRALPPGPTQLLEALGRIPPRSAHLLGARVLDARSSSECAGLYGVSESALAVHFLRSAELLEKATTSDRPIVLSDEPEEPADVEQQRALSLARAWDASLRVEPSQDQAPISNDPVLALLSLLRQHSAEVRRLSDAREREFIDSPAGRRREWVRRLALGALVVLGIWLWLRTR
jgi:hypothetical protein